MTRLTWLPYLLLLLAFELAGDVAAKEFALHGRAWRMLLGLALIACGNVSWQLMVRNGMDLSRGGVMFAVGVGAGTVALGVLGYGETVTTRGAVGLAFGLLSIWLLAA